MILSVVHISGQQITPHLSQCNKERKIWIPNELFVRETQNPPFSENMGCAYYAYPYISFNLLESLKNKNENHYKHVYILRL